MAMTKSEKLLTKIGKLVECEICGKHSPFDRTWMMTSKKEIVCPKCQPAVLKKGELLVSI